MLLFNQEKKNDPTAQVEQQLQFSNVALAADLDKTQPNDSKNTMTKEAEPWQFYFMMLLGGIYMSMVLTDWDSEDG
jgi:hypothetical protein